MIKDISYLLDRKDLKNRPSELREICEIIFRKGKGIRSQLVSLVGHSIFLNKKDLLFLSQMVEYIHNSSLLHDDFIDHSKVRRNHKTAWLEFSPSQAVLSGDYLLARVILYLVQTKNLELIKKTAEAICQLAEGEFLQRELCPFQNKDLKKRDRVSELKTGSLFKWCLQAPFIYKNRKDPRLYQLLDSIGFYFGLLFQRSDDLMDFAVRNKDKKPYFSDIKQKHFNSFACFLLKNSSLQKEKKLKEIRSVSAVYKLFPDFEKKIQAFDKINANIIKTTEECLEQLKPLLKKKEWPLIAGLKEWPHLFYWRQKQEKNSDKTDF